MKKQINEVARLQKIAGILNEDMNPAMPAKKPTPKVLVLDPDGSVGMYNSLAEFKEDTGNEYAKIDRSTPITADTAKSFGIENGNPNMKWNAVIDKFTTFYETINTEDEGIVIVAI